MGREETIKKYSEVNIDQSKLDEKERESFEYNLKSDILICLIRILEQNLGKYNDQLSIVFSYMEDKKKLVCSKAEQQNLSGITDENLLEKIYYMNKLIENLKHRQDDLDKSFLGCTASEWFKANP